MADFYQAGHRALQEEFKSAALADRLREVIVRPALDADAQTFIEQQDHFFLSTLGADGFPTVSYKGGGCRFRESPNPGDPPLSLLRWQWHVAVHGQYSRSR